MQILFGSTTRGSAISTSDPSCFYDTSVCVHYNAVYTVKVPVCFKQQQRGHADQSRLGNLVISALAICCGCDAPPAYTEHSSSTESRHRPVNNTGLAGCASKESEHRCGAAEAEFASRVVLSCRHIWSVRQHCRYACRSSAIQNCRGCRIYYSGVRKRHQFSASR